MTTARRSDAQSTVLAAVRLMTPLAECELAEARATISRALDEDLRYGPDVTTLGDGARRRHHHRVADHP